MDQLWEILGVVAVALVAAVMGLVAFVRSRSRKAPKVPAREESVEIPRTPPKKTQYTPSSGVRIDTSKSAAPTPAKHAQTDVVDAPRDEAPAPEVVEPEALRTAVTAHATQALAAYDVG